MNDIPRFPLSQVVHACLHQWRSDFQADAEEGDVPAMLMMARLGLKQWGYEEIPGYGDVATGRQ